MSAAANGLSALPGREEEALGAINEAIGYAVAVGAANVHVMAGNAGGEEAAAAFLANLDHAAHNAAEQGIGILVEPLNRHDAPDYFLRNTDQARRLIERLGAPNVRLMFDCYHVQRTEGDVVTRLADLLPIVGHIQIAASPDRGAPDHGELHYPFVLRAIRDLGYEAPIGVEYKPGGETGATLGWLAAAREI